MWSEHCRDNEQHCLHGVGSVHLLDLRLCFFAQLTSALGHRNDSLRRFLWEAFRKNTTSRSGCGNLAEDSASRTAVWAFVVPFQSDLSSSVWGGLLLRWYCYALCRNSKRIRRRLERGKVLHYSPPDKHRNQLWEKKDAPHWNPPAMQPTPQTH